MKTIAIITTVCLLLAVTAPAAAQAEDPFNPQPQQQNKPKSKPPTKDKPFPKTIEEAISKVPFEVRQVDELPNDLKGTAAIYSVGKKEYGFSASLYVPSYYDPSRPWPLLIEMRGKRRSAYALWEFHEHAEKHGFLLLAVEQLYVRGERGKQEDAWTRRGQGKVTTISRPMIDFQMDMEQDEKNVLNCLKEVQAKYSVDPEAIGTTGFMINGWMAYRLGLGHPKTFCTVIARSTGVPDLALSKDYMQARKLPISIIYGEKETTTLKQSEDMIQFFKDKGFKNVKVERIPLSGVDSRPEIASNYFQGTLQEILAPEKVDFYRVYRQAALCLVGDQDESKPKPGEDPKAKADPKADDEDDKNGEAKLKKQKAKTVLMNPSAAMAGLGKFMDRYPQSRFKASCKFLAARLAFEKLDDAKGAEKILREFLDRPLYSSPLAPRAILYLAEKVIDHDADTQEAIRVLGKITNRRDARAEVTSRAKELRKELIKKLKQQTG